MTQNQLTYWRNQEEIRANQENEAIKRDTLAETARANRRREDQYDRELSERERSNRENESINWGRLNESIRNNKQIESLRASELDERVRSDMVNESLKASQLAFEKKQFSSKWPVEKAKLEAETTNLAAQFMLNLAKAGEAEANKKLTNQKYKTEKENTKLTTQKIKTEEYATSKTKHESEKAEKEADWYEAEAIGRIGGNAGNASKLLPWLMFGNGYSPFNGGGGDGDGNDRGTGQSTYVAPYREEEWGSNGLIRVPQHGGTAYPYPYADPSDNVAGFFGSAVEGVKSFARATKELVAAIGDTVSSPDDSKEEKTVKGGLMLAGAGLGGVALHSAKGGSLWLQQQMKNYGYF